ncbi:winged helix-turn-helix domain-containing protein [Leptothrix cholodnii]|uniref:winged helix-turn-helix domain-containing protein n=1 Tax=Leptothrix cholodnii TaxID=34029 RepID=UPI0009FD6A99
MPASSASQPASCRSIDRASSEPFYLQLAEQLGDAIRRCVLKPGDGMPSESALCRDWTLSRATVRQALRTLEERGTIRLVPRRGAFVAPIRETDWVLPTSVRCGSNNTDLPINLGKPARSPAMGYGIQGRGQVQCPALRRSGSSSASASGQRVGK